LLNLLKGSTSSAPTLYHTQNHKTNKQGQIIGYYVAMAELAVTFVLVCLFFQ